MSFNPYEFDNSLQPDRQEMNQVQTLNDYVVHTFLWMMLGLMITFFVAIVSWMTGAVFFAVRFHWVILIATLVLSFTMGARIEHMSVGTAKTIFMIFSSLLGLTLSVYLVIFEMMSFILAFCGTALMFGALAAYGHYTDEDLSRFKPLLTGGLLFLIAFGLLSMFIPGLSAMDRVVSLFGIAVFLGYTAYDTQKIKEYYYYYSGYPDMMEKASIFSALQLYLDFLNLFVYLINYLGKRKD